MQNARPGIGLFGGRFDPVHRGHMNIAQAAADALQLSEVRWIITATPPHKSAVASANDRYEMVRLALGELGDPRMALDDREIEAAKRGQPNYTADTVKSIQTEFPTLRLIWILGEDQLENFTTWSRWEWLIKNVEIAVCSRPDALSSEMIEKIKKLGGAIHRIPLPPDSISSTQIRRSISKKDCVDQWVAKPVSDYISQHHLYQT